MSDADRAGSSSRAHAERLACDIAPAADPATDERLAGYRPLAELKTAAGLDGKPEHLTGDIEYLTAVYALTSVASCRNPKDEGLDAAATALGDLIEVLHIRALAEVERLLALVGDETELAEARSWARHGYEIGQRSCLWTDHGVAPKWLTEGWEGNQFPACSHLEITSQMQEERARLIRERDEARDAADTLHQALGDAMRNLPMGSEAYRRAHRAELGESRRRAALADAVTALRDVGKDEEADRG